MEEERSMKTQRTNDENGKVMKMDERKNIQNLFNDDKIKKRKTKLKIV